MIDIHTHVMPGVDDGAKNIRMALEMIGKSYEEGVDTIIATPHCMPGVYNNIVNDSLIKKWNTLYQTVKEEGIPVHLRKGMEVLINDRSMRLIKEKKVWTLNNTDYLLVEFAFDEDPLWCTEKLKEVAKEGYIPIIAHPERYDCVQQHREIVYDWYSLGYGIQVNKESLLGQFGRREKQTADSLLRHNIVTCVASDTHRIDRRTPGMKDIFEYLNDRYGGEYTHMLTKANPSRIVNGKPMVGYKPIPYEYEE